jgi:hypothetical protein
MYPTAFTSRKKITKVRRRPLIDIARLTLVNLFPEIVRPWVSRWSLLLQSQHLHLCYVSETPFKKTGSLSLPNCHTSLSTSLGLNRGSFGVETSHSKPILQSTPFVARNSDTMRNDTELGPQSCHRAVRILTTELPGFLQVAVNKENWNFNTMPWYHAANLDRALAPSWVGCFTTVGAWSIVSSALERFCKYMTLKSA